MRPAIRTACAAALIALMGAGASAATVTITQQNAKSVFADAAGNNKWSQNVRIGGRVTDHVAAGPFRVKGDGGLGEIIAFCVDLDHRLQLPALHTYNHALFGGAILSNISALVSNAFSLVTDAKSGAAFQLAVWEIVEDSDAASFSLASGDFKVTDNPSSKSLASTWLGLIGDGTWKAGAREFTFLQADGVGKVKSQNLLAVDVAPVPLPASAWMLVAGFGALLGLRRRKTA
jgi:hypothetical protein